MGKLRILFVDDERGLREIMRSELTRMGHEVTDFADGRLALKALETNRFDAAILDLRMPSIGGIEVLEQLKRLSPDTEAVMMTGHASMETAIEAVRLGAFDYITKPAKMAEIEAILMKISEKRDLKNANLALQTRLQAVEGPSILVGDSTAMRSVQRLIATVAPTESTVLITGESGTGKELVAKAIHQLSRRARGPLVTVNCAALPATLLEAELFGHEKGAFTGANERRIGRVEQAQGGTLFLDEIGEIDATTQVKLLRLIGERTYERLGSGKTQSADVRFLSATNKDLKALVRAGTFREDLYFRIAVVPIHLPPLRDRVADIPLLAHAFLKEFARENEKKVNAFSTEALELMLRYRWPGNVRELRASIEHAVVLCRGDQVLPRDLPASVREPLVEAALGTAVVPPSLGPGKLSLREGEKQLIIHALRECEGNRTEAAKKLGVSRRTLHRKLHEFELHDL